MGRRTYDSIGRPLPGRRTVVVTRNPDWSDPTTKSAEGGTDVVRASNPEEAVAVAAKMRPSPQSQVFVVGGAEIYRQFLPKCTELYLTRVWSNVNGDTKLAIDLSEFRAMEQTRYPASPRDDVPTEFVRLIRRET